MIRLAVQKEGKALIRMSILRNYPVAFEERQIGLLQSVRFDRARKRVCALVVSCGMRGKRIVPSKHVCMIADGFILVDGLQRYSRSDNQELWPFVRDTTGLLTGRITDYAIERKTLDVFAVEILPGYCPNEIRNRVWMYEYSPAKDSQEMIIPDVLHGESSFSMEGNEVCGYRP